MDTNLATTHIPQNLSRRKALQLGAASLVLGTAPGCRESQRNRGTQLVEIAQTKSSGLKVIRLANYSSEQFDEAVNEMVKPEDQVSKEDALKIVKGLKTEGFYFKNPKTGKKDYLITFNNDHLYNAIQRKDLNPNFAVIAQQNKEAFTKLFLSPDHDQSLDSFKKEFLEHAYDEQALSSEFMQGETKTKAKFVQVDSSEQKLRPGMQRYFTAVKNMIEE